MTPAILSAQLDGPSVALDLLGAGAARVPLLWLRDHCRCSDCYCSDTQQRRLDTFALDDEPGARALQIERGGDALAIEWHDGHRSRYRAAFLRGAMEGAERPAPALWTAASVEQAMPAVDHAAVMSGDEGLLSLLESIARHGFCVVHGAPPTVAASKRLAERISYIRESIFGGLWSFSADLSHRDAAYTSLAIGLHTDGTYCHDAPGLQMLHCLDFTGVGGETLLSDGFRAAEDLRRDDPVHFALLTRVEVPGEYLESGVSLRSSRPVLRAARDGRLLQVSFNNDDRAPFLLPEPQMRAFYAALRALHRRITDPAAVLRFRLDPGKVLLVDNWRVLHGRAAFTGKRRLCGCYLNHEDFESRLRVLRASARGAGRERGSRA